MESKSQQQVSCIETMSMAKSPAESKETEALRSLDVDGFRAMESPGPAGHGGRVKGLGYLKTAYFIIAQMTGVGFLALPKSLANSGWCGLFMILLFCFMVGFSATRLGMAWVIVEERWPAYRKPVRQPYMDIAEKAFGPLARKLCFGCVIATLLGYGIAFTILIAGMMNSLVTSVSVCQWIVIVSVILCPATFLESPKDFWQASLLAVVSTSLAIVIIIIQLIIDKPLHPDPSYTAPGFITFSLGFSAILFAFGGASAFPTLQNDMEDRRDWWKSVVIGFSVILTLYLPIGVTGYAILGSDVPDNIVMGVTEGIPVILAIAFVIVNLLCTYVICMNPVDQAFEEIFKVPNNFNWKRAAVRATVVCFVMFICLAVPDFGKILNLFGGSTITALSFFFPPLMYLWLVDQKSDGKWEEKKISRLERIFLWFIVLTGLIGGITSTIFALMDILSPESLGKSCLVNFSLGAAVNEAENTTTVDSLI